MTDAPKAEQQRIIRELVFDISSDEPGLRARAILALSQFAGCSGVEEAVRLRYEVETDPVCRKSLEEILDACTAKADGSKIRLTGRTYAKENAKPQITKSSPPPVIDNPPLPEADQPLVSEPDGSENQTLIEKPSESVFPAWQTKLKEQLVLVFSERVATSTPVLAVFVVVLVCLVTVMAYSIIRSSDRITPPVRVEQKAVPKIYGGIQTEDVAPGQLIKGTLKDYEIFGQSWLFLSDDDRHFKLKLDKSPGFYKIEDKLTVRVESCTRNSRGQVMIIGSSVSSE